MNKLQKMLAELPKVDEVLSDERVAELCYTVPRSLIVNTVRNVIDKERQRIVKGGEAADCFDVNNFFNVIFEEIEKRNKPNLKRVINATGTILHTNLGRARLCKTAINAIQEITEGYSNLEYDIAKGERGSRYKHVEELILQITGAEAAIAVNNNAAATMLCLSAMAEDKEVIVSRGELVEIGGSFRIPDIMASSGAKLVEVGTTNKTKIADYIKAITEDTAAIMKVHTSNYRIVGFTSEAKLIELVELGKKKNLPVIYDMGSGLITDLTDYGIDEPTVLDGLKNGVDVMLFSGDKLLGGPQAGIIAGKKKYIDLMKKHSLARVVRMDKLTIAALEATLRSYLDIEKAKKEIPALKMITESIDSVKRRGERLIDLIADAEILHGEIILAEEQVGGGSAPNSIIKGYAVKIDTSIPAEKIERLMRKSTVPIIGRILRGNVCLDMRTVMDSELEVIADCLMDIDRRYCK